MNNYETMKKFVINIHVELHMEAVEEIAHFLDNGWSMVDYTPSHIVLERPPFIFEGTLSVLKTYVDKTSNLVVAVSDETGLIYTDKEGWMNK